MTHLASANEPSFRGIRAWRPILKSTLIGHGKVMSASIEKSPSTRRQRRMRPKNRRRQIAQSRSVTLCPGSRNQKPLTKTSPITRRPKSFPLAAQSRPLPF